MTKFWCPPLLIAMVRQFHNGMKARVQNYGVLSEPFPLLTASNRDLLYSCSTNTVLYDVSAMLTDAFNDCEAGFPIKYCFDGKLFTLEGRKPNLRCRQMC